MAQTDIPNAQKHIELRDTNVPWYDADIGEQLNPTAKDILKNYSKIPESEIEAHIYDIRDRAWQIWPYPCIGQFRFIDFPISQSEQYAIILDRMKSSPKATFLDLGCCFGQDIRKLVADGVPSTQCFASDLRPEFFELGFDLFRDNDRLKSRFIAADIFDVNEDRALKEIEGRIDIIFAGSFLHLFDYAGQVEACVRIVALLRPVPGSMLLGRQVGNINAHAKTHTTNAGNTMWRHNIESFEKMWREVGERTGTKWKVEANLGDRKELWRGNLEFENDGLKRLRFTVTRL